MQNHADKISDQSQSCPVVLAQTGTRLNCSHEIMKSSMARGGAHGHGSNTTVGWQVLKLDPTRPTLNPSETASPTWNSMFQHVSACFSTLPLCTGQCIVSTSKASLWPWHESPSVRLVRNTKIYQDNHKDYIVITTRITKLQNPEVCQEKVPLPPHFEAPCSVRCGRTLQSQCR